MEAAIEIAGFFAAHAVWSVSDGEPLIPLIAYELPNGKRQMIRLVADSNDEGVARGKEWIVKNPDQSVRAILIFDGFIMLEDGRTDALIVTVRDFTQEDAEVMLAVPYRPAYTPEGFAVHRPKFLDFTGIEPDWQKLGDALWRGIEQHEKGAEVWSAHLDESK